MSVDVQLSAAPDAADFPYRALSRAAVASCVMAVLALPGLIQAFIPFLFFAVIGIGCAVVSLRSIAQWPNEFSGRTLARGGLILNLLLLVGGGLWQTYVYVTEVPEGYTRVSFYDLQQPPPLPDLPTTVAVETDGKDVFIKGYIHPASGSGLLRRFILVPDLGTCCFGGQPRSTDMIEVTLTQGQTVRGGLTQRKLAGKFSVNQHARTTAGIDNELFYQLRVDQIR